MRTPTSALAALTAALAIGISACGAGANAAGGPVDMTMTVWTADQAVIDTYTRMADEFRTTHPDLGAFTVQSIPFANYPGRLTTQLSGGDAPDLGWLVESDIPALAEAGALADVGPVLRDDPAFAFGDVLPNTLTGLQRGDGLYGHPFANTTQPIVFNADLFAAAGVDSPLELFEAGRWTWPELARISRELVASGQARYGFDIPQFGFTTYAQLTPVLKAFGAQAWPGGNSCGYSTPEAVAAIEFLRTMVFTDDSFPAPGETTSFATGDTGMYLGPPSTLNQLTDAGFAFDLVPQPEGVNGADPFFGQAALVVFGNGQRPELAAELLAFLGNEENSRELARWFIPPRRTLLTPEIVAGSNPLLTPEAAARALVDPLPEATQLEFPTVLPELNSAVAPVLDGLWQPQADVPAVLAEVCAKAEPLLARS